MHRCSRRSGTMFTASLKPYQAEQDGRSAHKSIMLQYAGKDKWDKELKRCAEILQNRQWRGQSNFTLEKFVSQHRNAYISMKQCAEHISYQLPNEIMHVKYLLDAIDCSNAKLQAAMAQVKADKKGALIDFEKAAAAIIPSDPVSKKRLSGNKRHAAEISSAEIGGAAKDSKKHRVGTSGVELRFHTSAEYSKLNGLQRSELREWRKNQNGNKGKGNENKSQKFQAAVLAALAKHIKKLEHEQSKEDESKEEMKSFVMSVMKEAGSATVSSTVINEKDNNVPTS